MASSGCSLSMLMLAENLKSSTVAQSYRDMSAPTIRTIANEFNESFDTLKNRIIGIYINSCLSYNYQLLYYFQFFKINIFLYLDKEKVKNKITHNGVKFLNSLSFESLNLHDKSHSKLEFLSYDNDNKNLI